MPICPVCHTDSNVFCPQDDTYYCEQCEVYFENNSPPNLADLNVLIGIIGISEAEGICPNCGTDFQYGDSLYKAPGLEGLICEGCWNTWLGED